ncbi:putative short chain dehydrogenase/oxidoreductase [Rhexocercosporidium sp. MPI-PUGE-AT-0058]|nr:putative short chain dehydrogenase/oxidoreductase [Rhexocercosporidium sp. MPI-PUGE-AT-0058]
MSSETKKVLITGGAGGLGKAIAEAFLKASYTVTILDRNATLLATAISELSSQGSVHGIECDITSQTAVTEAIAESVKFFGELDIVINNAGIMDRLDPVGDVDMDLFQKVLNINLVAPAIVSKAAIKHWETRSKGPAGGVILNIGSAAGARGFVAGAAYTSSKHGLIGLTKNTAAYYRHKGIKCNIILPGGMQTNISDSFSTGIHQQGLELYQKASATGMEMLDIGKVARTCVFLCGEDAELVNGVCIAVDVGWSAH